ncbi:MAG: hypothetical protein C0518_00310 [Opitutus sp.]|nr:hypothetical protein [Opitutus sp.]
MDVRVTKAAATNMSAGMQVTFVIPLFNGLPYTQECVRTLVETLPAQLPYEIILVDDGSTDGTHDWLRTVRPPCHAIFNERNLGFAGACNRGAASARGHVLFFLNNDLVFLPGWFEPMREIVTRRADAALVGNVQRNARTGALDHAGIWFDEKGKPAHVRHRPLFPRLRGWREVPAVTGACFAIRRRVWEQLGAFDDGFRNGGEDIDLAFRARGRGYRNYVSLRSVVRHHVSASPGRKLRDEENSRRLAERWEPELALLAAPAWSRHYITTVWDRSPNFDDALGRSALRQAIWPGSPSPIVLQGVRQALAVEVARWREILDTVPGSSAPLTRRPEKPAI